MCGITGFLNLSGQKGTGCLRDMVASMTRTIEHRGPDAMGLWVDAAAGIALGHRRLAIIDLSPEGGQPMHSVCGRYGLVFNGEIYNHQELRQTLTSELGGQAWRGHSDTEVMLSAISQWGLREAVQRFEGMFAFALWDKQERMLHLVRDRLGEKPLYYGYMENALLFGSELKALRAHPAWRGEIDRGALTLFLRHSYIPAPYSVYQGILKLPPGTILSISATDAALRRLPQPAPYWSIRQIAEAGLAHPFPGSMREAAEHLEELLSSVIRRQMVADVPLGAFLSGGIDSSTVVAIMQSVSDRPVKTFTIGFHEEAYNEAQYAKEIAAHLGTDHTELYVTPVEARDVIPLLPSLYDEPFSDQSQVPTFLLAQLARRHVTVSLSGDGGDELFAGYNRYAWGRKIWRGVGWIPRPVRRWTGRGLTSLSPTEWDRAYSVVQRLLPAKFSHKTIGGKLHKLAEILDISNPEEIYWRLVSHWKQPESVVLGAQEPVTMVTDRNRWAKISDFTQRMMYLDTVTYLPDDILVKVDRASMGVGLESRIPFLDHRLVEFAWRLPLSLKVRHGQSKWLLRQVLYKYVPKQMLERPKMGFGLPIDSWLRGPLRDWGEALLDPRRLRREGFFNPQPIREKWEQHLSGQHNWQYYLWDVLMFQAWLEAQQPGHGLVEDVPAGLVKTAE